MAIPYLGRRFDAAGFRAYLGEVQFGAFRPKFVTLHHTGAPSLAQRPQGLSEQHLRNLLHYYQDQLGWSGAPHLFIDDQPQPIIVFQRLDRRGVHAVAFNAVSWGVEMLGNYDTEQFDAGRGAAVRDHALAALAAMCGRLGVAADTLKFHRDDPTTSKTCPGTRVTRADVVGRVAALLQQPAPADLDPDAWAEWTVVLPGGQPFVPVHSRDGRPIVRIRTFLKALGETGDLALARNRTVVRWTRQAGGPVELDVAELDSAGAAWCLLRSAAEAVGRSLTVADRKITLS